MLTHAEALTLTLTLVKRLRATGYNLDADAIEQLLNVGQKRSDGCAHFAVAGAGELEVGKCKGAQCASAHGVHFGVSWGALGYAGGVMDWSEVQRLIEHLQSLPEVVKA